MLEEVEKALDELGVGRGRVWNIGMPLPLGIAPRLNYGRKGMSDGGYPSSSRNYGKDWVGDFPRDEELWDDIPRARGIERVANDVLDMTKLRFVWFIFANHDERYCYNTEGERIPGVENGGKRWKTKKADNHITVRLGMDENTCMLHGHINVKVDENNIPTGLMEKGTRKYITDGDNRILELWEYTRRQSPAKSETVLPRRYNHNRKATFTRGHGYVPMTESSHALYHHHHNRYPVKGYSLKYKRYKICHYRRNFGY